MQAAFSFMATSFYVTVGILCLCVSAILVVCVIALIRVMIDGMV